MSILADSKVMETSKLAGFAVPPGGPPGPRPVDGRGDGAEPVSVGLPREAKSGKSFRDLYWEKPGTIYELAVRQRVSTGDTVTIRETVPSGRFGHADRVTFSGAFIRCEVLGVRDGVAMLRAVPGGHFDPHASPPATPFSRLDRAGDAS